ncbi:DinB family protein [Salimicrobium flavidum]|uniref:DinB family protein n=1 Tax=Salimicrobium flavidum TaxID=570947 RepID=UPI001F42F2B5|nr:DinB family protein [Salimicrobium flavidum]
MISLIDEGKEDYKPTKTSMEVGKLANHIVESSYTFVRLAADQSPAKLFDENDDKDLKSKASTYTQETEKLLTSLSEEDFDKTIDATNILGRELSAEAILQSALEHEIHHKGQLFIYVRELGHTDLPFFTSRGE